MYLTENGGHFGAVRSVLPWLWQFLLNLLLEMNCTMGWDIASAFLNLWWLFSHCPPPQK